MDSNSSQDTNESQSMHGRVWPDSWNPGNCCTWHHNYYKGQSHLTRARDAIDMRIQCYPQDEIIPSYARQITDDIRIAQDCQFIMARTNPCGRAGKVANPDIVGWGRSYDGEGEHTGEIQVPIQLPSEMPEADTQQWDGRV